MSNGTRYQQLQSWQWEHNTIATDLIRIYIGAALLVRGILFLTDAGQMGIIAERSGLDWIEYYVPFAHIAGGFLLTLGLFTRVAALIQIPVLVGAVLLVHLRQGLLSENQSLELAVLVLFILLVILGIGPGKLSLDYKFFGRSTSPVS